MAETTDSSKLPPAVDPLVGKILAGRFKLLELIDRGGMGKIYRAEQQPLGREVALKILDITDDGDGEFRQRFFLEASLCSKLSHPNTVRIFDYGASDDGVYFIAMEFLRGRTVHQLLKAEAPLEPMRAVRLMRQICGALGEAHDRGIVHRDLKPANVFLTRHGEEGEFPKVVDFGLVKDLGMDSELSKTGHVLGSPMYMSPEQVNNEEVDGRTDIYAAGLILYSMLTGQTPFPKGNVLALLMAQVRTDPKPMAEANPELDIPASLDWVVQRAIDKDRDRRFASMHELLKALKAVQKELRGDVANLELSLEDGLVVLPEGLEVSEEIRITEATSRQLHLEQPIDDVVDTTLHRPMPTEVREADRMARFFRGLSLLLALLLVAVLGTGLGMLVSEPEAATEVERPPPEPIVIKRIEVELVSKPPAEVERDGVLIGTTPLTLELLPDEEWVVELAADGHASRMVRLAADQPVLQVELEPQSGDADPEAGLAQPVPVPAQPVPAPQPTRAPTPTPEPEPEPELGEVRNPWAD